MRSAPRPRTRCACCPPPCTTHSARHWVATGLRRSERERSWRGSSSPSPASSPAEPLRCSARRGRRRGFVRVLMVTPRFLPDTGGVETHVAEVSRRVAAGGHRVRVLTTDLSGRLPAAEVVDDVEVRRVRAWPRGADYYFAPDLYPAVSKGDWDVVHVQSYHTLVAPLAMAGSLSASIPYVLTFHGGGHSSRVRNALRTPQLLLLRPLLVRAAGLVAVAAFEIDDYAS